MDAQLIFDKYLGKSDLPSDCSGNSRTPLAISSFREGSVAISYIIDNLEKKAGEDIFLSVIVAQNSNITAFGFDLQFPRQKLKPAGLEKSKITENFDQIEFHEISPGLLRIGGYKGNGKQDFSSGFFLTLAFRVEKLPIKANEFKIAATYDEICCDSIRTEIILKKPKERNPPKKYRQKLKKN